MSSRADLERLPRDELVIRARSLGVTRPEVMTRVELVDEIVRLSEHDPVARRRARGWLGIARDLVASLIEQGLNMPDAAELVRTTTTRVLHKAPVATVTLAEIYATQGHVRRALSMLGEVLSREPDHDVARKLRERLAKDAPPEPAQVDESEAAPDSEEIEAVESEPPSPPVVAIPKAEVDTLESGWEPAPAQKTQETSGENALVVVKTASDAWYLHWELSSGLPGQAWVKIVAWVPRVFGVARIEKDIRVNHAAGGVMLRSFGARAVVRGVLGTESPAGFVALAVASVVDRSNDPVVSWSPLGHERAAIDAVHRRALAALEARPS